MTLIIATDVVGLRLTLIVTDGVPEIIFIADLDMIARDVVRLSLWLYMTLIAKDVVRLSLWLYMTLIAKDVVRLVPWLAVIVTDVR